MWTIVLFDLPVVIPEQRKAASQFRNQLLKAGYSMLQFSVYSKVCPSDDFAEKEMTRIAQLIPSEGNVRVMKVTHKQYASMRILLGKPTTHEKYSDRQLFLF